MEPISGNTFEAENLWLDCPLTLIILINVHSIKLTPSGLLYFYRLVFYQRSFFFVVDDTQHRDLWLAKVLQIRDFGMLSSKLDVYSISIQNSGIIVKERAEKL